ncbi:pilus assembly protein TadG-related protein [Methylobacterium sp. JK268]
MPGFLSHAMRCFAGARGGNVALILGVAAPVLFGLVGVAVDYASWRAHTQTLQQAADAAALAAMSDMQIAAATAERIQAVAEQQVRAQVPIRDGDGPLTVRTQAVSRSQEGGDFVPTPLGSDSAPPTGVTVTLSQRKRAVMSRMVTPQLTDIVVTATAETFGTVKVCVVALDPAGEAALGLTDRAQVSAGNCSIYALSTSGAGLRADASSQVTALKTCTVGGYGGSSGNYRPTPITRCPPIRDPLAARIAPAVGGCKERKTVVIRNETRLLAPGTYCGGLVIGPGAVVTLSPGIYIMKDGPLVVGPPDTETRAMVGTATASATSSTSTSSSSLAFDGTATASVSAGGATVNASASASGASVSAGVGGVSAGFGFGSGCGSASLPLLGTLGQTCSSGTAPPSNSDSTSTTTSSRSSSETVALPAGSLKGSEVGFYFTGAVDADPDGVVRPVNFMQDSTVTLTAPKSGDMAGLLFHEDRSAAAGHEFRVGSDNARRLVGTIYLPEGTFAVRTNQIVADQSEYTAIVARRIALAKAPNLVVNADYGKSDIPVPKGLGPTSAMPTLTH